MQSYLMMLYVTLEQELALKTFFVDQGWTFCKPDLSITTDRLGPCVKDVVTSSSDCNIPAGKRKARHRQLQAPDPKLAKITAAPMSPKANETICSVQADTEDSEQIGELVDEELKDIGNLGDGNAALQNSADPKIKLETHDFSYRKDNDDDENTNVDYSYEKSNIESEMEVGIRKHFGDKAGNEVGTFEEAVTAEATEFKETKTGKGTKYGIRHHHRYTQSQIDAAFKYYEEQQILGRKVSMRQLAKMFSVPMTTLFNHIRAASGKLQKNIICEVCGQTFIYQHQLKQHMEQQHEGHRNMYTCPQCPKSFCFKSRLQHHINMHNDERPYMCKNMCGKSYFSPQSRYSHEIQCQSKYPRPFQCTKCGLSFKVQSALNRHNAAKHGAPQYSCVCGQAFGWSQSFNRHRKTCKKIHKAVSEEIELQRIVETLQDDSTIQEDMNMHVPLDYVYIH